MNIIKKCIIVRDMLFKISKLQISIQKLNYNIDN